MARRICIISPNLVYDSFNRLSGVPLIARNLGKHLGELGYEVAFLSTMECSGEKLPGIYYLPYRYYDPRNLQTISSFIRKFDPDIIHIVAQFQLGSVLATLLKQFFGLPIVLTPTSIIPRVASPSYRLEQIFPARILLNISNVNKIICHSNYSAEIIANFIDDKEKIAMVPFGLSTEFYSTTIENNAFKIWDITFWTSGNKERGFDTFLESLKKLPKMNLRINLAILNLENGLDKKLNNMISMNGNVFHISQIKNGKYLVTDGDDNKMIDISTILQNSRLVVLPYRYNPQEPPLSLVETMALGVPVITTRLGSNAELFESSEINCLISSGNSTECAEKIKEMLASSEKIRKNATLLKAKIHDRYSWNNAMRIISENYEELID